MKRRILANLVLFIATALAGVAFGAGLVETALHFPRYFANPPASFDLWRADNIHSAAFWGPLQQLSLLFLIGSLFLNWPYRLRRNLLLVAVAITAGITVWTVIYFVPEVKQFMATPGSAPATPELVARAQHWYSRTWVRQILSGVSFLAMLLAYGIGSRACRPGEARRWQRLPVENVSPTA